MLLPLHLNLGGNALTANLSDTVNTTDSVSLTSVLSEADVVTPSDVIRVGEGAGLSLSDVVYILDEITIHLTRPTPPPVHTFVSSVYPASVTLGEMEEDLWEKKRRRILEDDSLVLTICKIFVECQ